MHLFFHCPFAREVWCKAPLQSDLNVDVISDLKTGISLCNKMQQLPATTRNIVVSAPWLLWTIWSSRNKKIFDHRIISEEETIEIATSAEEEWKKAQLGKDTTPTRAQQASTCQNTRQGTEMDEHPPGTLICQTDAAWMEQTKNAGLGWVVLNHNREIGMRCCKPVAFVKSPSEAEALCIYEALLSLQSQQHTRIIIELDAKNVITAITSQKPPINLIGAIEDIINIAKPFSSLSFHFIPRSDNIVADDLAQKAIRSMTSGHSSLLL